MRLRDMGYGLCRQTDTQTYSQVILVSLQCHELHWTDKKVIRFLVRKSAPPEKILATPMTTRMLNGYDVALRVREASVVLIAESD